MVEKGRSDVHSPVGPFRTLTWQAGSVPDRDREPTMHPRLIAALVLVVLLVVFIFENTRRTKIRFIVPQFTAPLWVALAVATLVGAAAGALAARHRR